MSSLPPETIASLRQRLKTDGVPLDLYPTDQDFEWVVNFCHFDSYGPEKNYQILKTCIERRNANAASKARG